MPTDSTSWVWWVVSVIGVGVVINLFSAFLYPRIEKAWARRSATRRAKLEAKELAFQQQVQRLVEHPERLDSLKLDLILLYLQFLSLVAVGALTLFFLSRLPEVVVVVPGNALIRLIVALVCFGLLMLLLLGGMGFSNALLDRIGRTRRLIRKAEAKLTAEDEGPAGTSGEESGQKQQPAE